MAVVMSREIQIPSMGTAASDLEVGGSVFLNVNGVLTEFLVVHQGLPSSVYDASCDGTWLLMKDVYEQRAWHSSNLNKYADSTIHSYLNSTMLGMFDSAVQNAIKQAKIPYVNGTGYSKNVASGANGLSAKVFLLSAYEVGWTQTEYQYCPEDGACLSYFSGTSEGDAKRIANLNGGAVSWWLRSPDTYSSAGQGACRLLASGECAKGACTATWGIRPALILPSNSLFDPDTNEFLGVA